MKIVDSSVKEEKMELEVGKWDKLKNWDKVQGDIGEMLKNVEKFDDSMTLYYGPQVCIGISIQHFIITADCIEFVDKGNIFG